MLLRLYVLLAVRGVDGVSLPELRRRVTGEAVVAVAPYGYFCEDCNAAVFPTTTHKELIWLKDRLHVVREVARHSGGGLDSWMMEGLAFLDDHSGHGVTIIRRQ